MNDTISGILTNVEARQETAVHEALQQDTEAVPWN
jgi:hypothetical protein